MLTTDQAIQAADSLADARRSASAAERDAAAPPIPLFYRSPALASLPRSEQAWLLACARRSVFGSWQAKFFGVSLLLGILLGTWLVSSVTVVSRSPWVPGMLLVVVLAAQLRMLLVRLRLMEMLAGRATGQSEDA